MALGGCATPAPPLPVDTTSVNTSHPLTAADFTQQDLALSCVDVMAEKAQADAVTADLDASIQANRVVVRGGAPMGRFIVYGPITVSKENPKSTFDSLNLQIARRDTLTKLAIFKRCLGPPPALRSTVR